MSSLSHIYIRFTSARFYIQVGIYLPYSKTKVYRYSFYNVNLQKEITGKSTIVNFFITNDNFKVESITAKINSFVFCFYNV